MCWKTKAMETYRYCSKKGIYTYQYLFGEATVRGNVHVNLVFLMTWAIFLLLRYSVRDRLGG